MYCYLLVIVHISLLERDQILEQKAHKLRDTKFHQDVPPRQVLIELPVNQKQGKSKYDFLIIFKNRYKQMIEHIHRYYFQPTKNKVIANQEQSDQALDKKANLLAKVLKYNIENLSNDRLNRMSNLQQLMDQLEQEKKPEILKYSLASDFTTVPKTINEEQSMEELHFFQVQSQQRTKQIQQAIEGNFK